MKATATATATAEPQDVMFALQRVTRATVCRGVRRAARRAVRRSVPGLDDAVAKPGETRAPGFEGSHAVEGASKGQAAHVEQEPRCVEVHDGRFSASLQHDVCR